MSGDNDSNTLIVLPSDLNIRPEGCKECRLVGGIGLIGASLYVWQQARKHTKRLNKGVAFVFGGALFGFGVARLLNYPRRSLN